MTNCGIDICKSVEVTSDDVVYNGPALANINVSTNASLTSVLSSINSAICPAGVTSLFITALQDNIPICIETPNNLNNEDCSHDCFPDNTERFDCIGNSGSLMCNEFFKVPCKPPINTSTGYGSIQCGPNVPTCFLLPYGPTYNWYLTETGGEYIPNEHTALLVNYVITETTYFYVSVVNSKGCESTLRTLVVATVIQSPDITITSTRDVSCLGQSFELNYTPVTTDPYVTYQWTASPAIGSGMPTGSTLRNPTITPTIPGTYTYTLLALAPDSQEPFYIKCRTYANITIQTKLYTVIETFSVTPIEACNDGNNVTIQLNAYAPGVPSSGYSWHDVFGNTYLTGPSHTITRSIIADNEFVLTATLNDDTCSAIQSGTVFVNNDVPQAVSVNNNNQQCGYGYPSAEVSSNSGSITPTFRWYDADLNLLQEGTSNRYNTAVGENGITIFVLFVSEVFFRGCEGPKVRIDVTIIQPDQISLLANTYNITLGESFNATVAYVNQTYNTYDFNIEGNGIVGRLPMIANTPETITPTDAGTWVYRVIGTDNSGFDCSATDTITVIVAPAPTTTSTTTNR